MNNKQMMQLINKTAKSAKKSYYNSFENKADAKPIVDINYGLPYVAINGIGEEYFFQGEEAGNLLEDAVNTSNKFNVTVENAIIWMAQSW